MISRMPPAARGNSALPRVLAEEKDAAQQEKKGDPEGADAEQPHENAGEIGAEDAEEVLDLAAAAGIEEQAWVARIERKQADQAEHHHEEKKNADDFFFHS